MFPIKLTDNLYINPHSVVLIEFTTGNQIEDAFLTIIFENPELSHQYVRGHQANEAFANWKTAHEERSNAADKSDYRE